MRIYDCKTNHITNPLGYYITNPTFSWKVTDTEDIAQKYVIIQISLDKEMKDIVYDSGKLVNVYGSGYEVPYTCEPMIRYYWKVIVCGDKEIAESGVHWFERGKDKLPWKGVWITPKEELNSHPIMYKTLTIAKSVKSARIYVCGLGLYEMNLNGIRVGEDYFNPHYTSYDKWIQYQTYDPISYLNMGENHIEITLGNGWYLGDYGLDCKRNLYGKEFMLLFELHISYEDGSSELICSDESWTVKSSNISQSGIYYGEDIDARIPQIINEVKEVSFGFHRLEEMRSLPVVVCDEIKPELFHCSNGEVILDFKQNLVGILQCTFDEGEGTHITIQFGEVLQDNKFYRENYRTARSEFHYISDGIKRVITPKFTFFGFRYARVTGVTELKAECFTALVLHSQLQETGKITCSNEKINQLISNTKWGIKGNSLDLPTDCPQRNERMGWTGDCQAISRTSMFFFDMYAFYDKWLYELKLAQDEEGCVPDVVPAADYGGKGACGWADAATIVPYNLYLVHGDIGILRQQYDSMKAWVDYIRNHETDDRGLRSGELGRHYGDWLALDHPMGEIDPDCAEGYTDKTYLASVYYAYSADIVAKAAKLLGNEVESEAYATLSKSIKKAIYDCLLEERTPQMNTQTAYILALAFDLYPPHKKEEYITLLRNKFQADKNKLHTGFIGTIFALDVLCSNGMAELAYDLFLTEEYPGWLYAINLGATTIWERWNSLMPDGSVNKGGMNSFNHYAYGMVIGWMFQYCAGIKPLLEVPGYRAVEIKPYPDKRLPWVSAEYNSPMGIYTSSYRYEENKLIYAFEIPFACTAKIILQNIVMRQMEYHKVKEYNIQQEGKDIVIFTKAGHHTLIVNLE